MSHTCATHRHTQAHTHTRLKTALCPRLPGLASTRKVKPIWILLEQETVSGSGISWAICKSAARSRQITTPAPHHSVFYRPVALPAAQPTASKHWRHNKCATMKAYRLLEQGERCWRHTSLQEIYPATRRDSKAGSRAFHQPTVTP